MKRRIALCIIIAVFAALLGIIGMGIYSMRIELDSIGKSAAVVLSVLAISSVIAWAFSEVSR